jgi:hypothetical protein
MIGPAAHVRAFLSKSSRRAAWGRGSVRCLLGALSIICACTVSPAAAQPKPQDLWQTYMDAARASDASGDFAAEAVILNAASAFAKKADPQGQRPTLTRLPLILAYGELHRTDLMRPLTALGMDIDESNLDEGYEGFVSTMDDFAEAYYSRWGAHLADSPSADGIFRQGVRFYGAKNSFSIEVAFRSKLMPDDKVGLAETLSFLGLTYQKVSDLDCAGYDFGEASQIFQDSRQILGAMEAADSHFTVGSQAGSIAGQSTLRARELSSQVAELEIFERYLSGAAYETLHHTEAEGLPTANTDWDFCHRLGPPAMTPAPVGFDAQISRALLYHKMNLGLLQDLYKYWPNNTLFGVADANLAEIYRLQYERSQLQSKGYVDSPTKTGSAYKSALKNLSSALGPNAQVVQGVASAYVNFLIEARLPTEAKRIEARYGVAPGN